MNLLELAEAALAAFETRASKPTITTTKPDVVTTEPYRHWRVSFVDRDPLEVILSDAQTHDIVLAIYPGAQIEPLPELPRQSATPAEAEEIHRLIAIIIARDSDSARAEAIRVTLADPFSALTSFRALAADAAICNATS